MTTQILMFSQPRTACHVLERMLSNQSDTAYFGHAFGESVPIAVEWETQKSCLEGMPEADKARYEAAVERECNRWRDEMSTAAKNGQKFFMHTHPYFLVERDRALQYLKSPSNDKIRDIKPVLVPDELLLNPDVRPLFVIRHPYLWIPSVYRAATSNVKLGNFGDGGKGVYYMAGNLTWAHELFDWYTSRGVTPTVVDAEDFLGSEAYVRRLCEEVGFNPDEAKLSWEKGSGTFHKEMPELLRNTQDQLLSSTGPRQSRRACDINLNTEQVKWEEEYGENAKWFFASESRLSTTQHHYGVKIWEMGASSPVFLVANIACMALKQALFMGTRHYWAQYVIYKSALVKSLVETVREQGLGHEPYTITAIAALSSFERIEQHHEASRLHMLAVRNFIQPEDLDDVQWLFCFSMDLQLAVQTEQAPLLDEYVPQWLKHDICLSSEQRTAAEIRRRRICNLCGWLPMQYLQTIHDVFYRLDLVAIACDQLANAADPPYGTMYALERKLCCFEASMGQAWDDAGTNGSQLTLILVWAIHVAYLVFTRDSGTQRSEMIATLLSRMKQRQALNIVGSGFSSSPLAIWMLFTFAATAIESKHSIASSATSHLQQALKRAKKDTFIKFRDTINRFPTVQA